MPAKGALTSVTSLDAAGFALAGYAFLCACAALALPSLPVFPLMAAGVLLPLATALTLAHA